MNPVVHFEMPAKDKKRVSTFYTKAFGWNMQVMGKEYGGYIVATTSPMDKNNMHLKKGAINGGFYEWKKENHLPSVVIEVPDVKAAMKSVLGAGGKVVTKPQEIQGVGLWVVFLDTEGNRVSLIQPPKKK